MGIRVTGGEGAGRGVRGVVRGEEEEKKRGKNTKVSHLELASFWVPAILIVLDDGEAIPCKSTSTREEERRGEESGGRGCEHHKYMQKYNICENKIYETDIKTYMNKTYT